MLRLLLRPVWLIAIIALLLVAPIWLNNLIALFVNEPPSSDHIAPMFTPQVQHWGDDIGRWAESYSLDPNLLATVMQIESCGHPTVSSPAGAQGLFQVMPFHFSLGEDMLDPDTNVRRGADYLNLCLARYQNNAGMALACYNGGATGVSRPYNQWAAETQRYYNWGTGIYADAITNATNSQTLNDWLLSGGFNLCNRATNALRLYRQNGV